MAKNQTMGPVLSEKCDSSDLIGAFAVPTLWKQKNDLQSLTQAAPLVNLKPGSNAESI